ncbi:hypothetical protein STEG23_023392, partial [Scotinomys teguina]
MQKPREGREWKCLDWAALLTDKVKVKEQLVEAEQSLEKIQEEEVRKSVSATDTHSEDEEESQLKRKAKKVKVKEFFFSSGSESDLEKEERLEQEIVDLERKRKKCKVVETQRPRPACQQSKCLKEGILGISSMHPVFGIFAYLFCRQLPPCEAFQIPGPEGTVCQASNASKPQAIEQDAFSNDGRPCQY